MVPANSRLSEDLAGPISETPGVVGVQGVAAGQLSFHAQGGDALSVGEKQRVSVARALANEPQLIPADEPTANLDSKHGREVVVLLRDIGEKPGRTVIIVSHDGRIRETADRVLWLEDGRFKEIGRLARDPVRGMAVEEAGAVTQSYRGRTYRFCANGCRRESGEDPVKFVKEEA